MQVSPWIAWPSWLVLVQSKTKQASKQLASPSPPKLAARRRTTGHRPPSPPTRAEQTCVVKPREPCLAFHPHLHPTRLLFPFPPSTSSPPCNGALNTRQPPSASLHSPISHSPRYATWLRRLQTSPLAVASSSPLTTLPHRLISSVRACLPGHKALTPRPSPPRLFRHSPTALPTLTAIRRPLLFVDRRASRPD